MNNTAKRHKLKNGSSVDNLPIISNVGTASCQLAKYLAKLLSPLSKSQYPDNSIKQLIDMIKNERIPREYKKHFHVFSPFTKVPLDYTTDLTLK